MQNLLQHFPAFGGNLADGVQGLVQGDHGVSVVAMFLRAAYLLSAKERKSFGSNLWQPFMRRATARRWLKVAAGEALPLTSNGQA